MFVLSDKYMLQEISKMKNNLNIYVIIIIINFIFEIYNNKNNNKKNILL